MPSFVAAADDAAVDMDGWANANADGGHGEDCGEMDDDVAAGMARRTDHKATDDG